MEADTSDNGALMNSYNRQHYALTCNTHTCTMQVQVGPRRVIG